MHHVLHQQHIRLVLHPMDYRQEGLQHLQQILMLYCQYYLNHYVFEILQHLFLFQQHILLVVMMMMIHY
jgi:hypothetical protein